MDEPEQHSRLAPLLANHRRFLAFVERRVESREDAEEILQDAFVRGVERVGDVRDEDSVVAWFYSILRNALVDRHRRRSREPSVLADASELLIAPPDAELHREVCSCIEGLLPLLNPGYAELVRLVDLQGKSIAVVAKQRGVSDGSVRVRLHRARAALRREVHLTCRTCAEHGCMDCTCGRPGRG